MSDNYYILLDLDPTVDDWAVIEAAIISHKRSWYMQKNQGAPAARRKAERYVKLIPDMQQALADPSQRRRIAKEALQELTEKKRELFTKLDGLIKMLAGPFTDMETVNQLVRQVGSDMTEAEVIARLKSRGITVTTTANNGDSGQIPKIRAKLERTVAEGIRDNLRHIGAKNLYEFLGLKQRSSPTSLCDAADTIYAELRRKGAIDPDSTARQELAGHCKVVFKDPAAKARYDNTYAAEAMEGLNEYLEFAGRDAFLDQQELDKIVNEARSLGVAQDIALEYITEYAQKRKWLVHKATNGSTTALPLCGFCDVVALTMQATRCHNCGQELVQACPRCNAPTQTQNECCSVCGCSTGDAPLVQGLLREGKEFLTQGDLIKAEACFDRALIYWPNWRPAIEEKGRIATVRTTQETALAAIETLVRISKLEEARAAIERLQREFGAVGTEKLKTRIDHGITQAIDAVHAADLLRAAGKDEAAITKYSDALGYCADFQPALRALARFPPPGPTALNVTMVGTTAQLNWEPIATQQVITYKIQRKAAVAPTTVLDGVNVGNVRAPVCHDISLPPGIPWYYAVFAIRNGVASLNAATSGPHLRTTDPIDVSIQAGNAQVTLQWTRPQGCTAIEIWRNQDGNIPALGTGSKIAVTGDSVVDSGLQNGVNYSYCICACFIDPRDGVSVIRSTGLSVTATPVDPAPPVTDLQARREEHLIILTWTPPPRGEVQIRQTRQAIATVPGELIPLATAERFGTPLSIIGRGTTQIAVEGPGKMFFIPLSIVGQTAVLGAVAVVSEILKTTGVAPQVLYQVRVKRNLLRRTIDAAWVELRTSAELPPLPEIEVILHKDRPAISPEEGRVIATAHQLALASSVARIDLPVAGISGYIKLFFKDGKNASKIRLQPAAAKYLKLG